tara:strand:+ start:718 stop:1128 length:411 start_codon:yes stop_codon:yes gene_type:complete
MIYQIVSPVVATIEGDSFKEAIKNYVKFNHNLNIRNLIVKDQADHAYEAKLRYYIQNEKNKVGIDVYPYTNVSYPVINPVINPVFNHVINPVINPVTSPFISSIVPTYIKSPPVVSAPNSRFFATDSNIFVKRPYY